MSSVNPSVHGSRWSSRTRPRLCEACVAEPLSYLREGSRVSLVLLTRRDRYRASILRGDYFVLKHLTRFLDDKLRERVRPGAVVGDVGCGEQPLRALITKLGAKYIG